MGKEIQQPIIENNQMPQQGEVDVELAGVENEEKRVRRSLSKRSLEVLDRLKKLEQSQVLDSETWHKTFTI